MKECLGGRLPLSAGELTALLFYVSLSRWYYKQPLIPIFMCFPTILWTWTGKKDTQCLDSLVHFIFLYTGLSLALCVFREFNLPQSGCFSTVSLPERNV